jgi:hypothetical protein
VKKLAETADHRSRYRSPSTGGIPTGIAASCRGLVGAAGRLAGSFTAHMSAMQDAVKIPQMIVGDISRALLDDHCRMFAGLTILGIAKQGTSDGRSALRANFERTEGSAGSSGAGRAALAFKPASTVCGRRARPAQL